MSEIEDLAAYKIALTYLKEASSDKSLTDAFDAVSNEIAKQRGRLGDQVDVTDLVQAKNLLLRE